MQNFEKFSNVSAIKRRKTSIDLPLKHSLTDQGYLTENWNLAKQSPVLPLPKYIIMARKEV